MAKIVFHVPVGPEGEALVKSDQLGAVYAGCQQTLRRLGDLAGAVTRIRVEFARDSDSGDWYGPGFQVYCVDQVGKEVWFGTDYAQMGLEESRTYNPTPSADQIADYLCNEFVLPCFIRSRLAIGAKELGRINTASKRLGKSQGFRLEHSDSRRGAVPFAADSQEGALALVAAFLGISYPMTEEAFHNAGGKTVFRDFTVPMFPPKA